MGCWSDSSIGQQCRGLGWAARPYLRAICRFPGLYARLWSNPSRTREMLCRGVSSMCRWPKPRCFSALLPQTECQLPVHQTDDRRWALPRRRMGPSWSGVYSGGWVLEYERDTECRSDFDSYQLGYHELQLPLHLNAPGAKQYTKCTPITGAKQCTKCAPITGAKQCTKCAAVIGAKQCTKCTPVTGAKQRTKCAAITGAKQCTKCGGSSVSTDQLTR